MQKRLAGTKPNCQVRIPIRQITTLFALATSQPCHSFRPTRMVELTVSAQEI